MRRQSPLETPAIDARQSQLWISWHWCLPVVEADLLLFLLLGKRDEDFGGRIGRQLLLVLGPREEGAGRGDVAVFDVAPRCLRRQQRVAPIEQMLFCHAAQRLGGECLSRWKSTTDFKRKVPDLLVGTKLVQNESLH